MTDDMNVIIEELDPNQVTPPDEVLEVIAHSAVLLESIEGIRDGISNHAWNSLMQEGVIYMYQAATLFNENGEFALSHLETIDADSIEFIKTAIEGEGIKLGEWTNYRDALSFMTPESLQNGSSVTALTEFAETVQEVSTSLPSGIAAAYRDFCGDDEGMFLRFQHDYKVAAQQENAANRAAAKAAELAANPEHPERLKNEWTQRSFEQWGLVMQNPNSFNMPHSLDVFKQSGDPVIDNFKVDVTGIVRDPNYGLCSDTAFNPEPEG